MCAKPLREADAVIADVERQIVEELGEDAHRLAAMALADRADLGRAGLARGRLHPGKAGLRPRVGYCSSSLPGSRIPSGPAELECDSKLTYNWQTHSNL